MSGNNRIEVKRENGRTKTRQDLNDDEIYCNKLRDL